MTDLEYIVVSDKNSEVVLSTNYLNEVIDLVRRIEQCGGECTVFKRMSPSDLE